MQTWLRGLTPCAKATRLTLAALLLAACSGANELTTVAEYEKAVLVSVTPRTKEQLALIEQFIEGDLMVDSWTEWNGIGLKAELMIPAGSIQQVNKSFEDAGMKPTIMLSNVAETLREHHKEDVQAEKMMPMNSVVGKYPRLSELYAWYKTIADQHKHVTIHSIGKSTEGRDINVVKIAKRPNLPVVFVECLMHAREWVAMASCVYDIDNLLTSQKDEIKKLTDSLEFQFVPVSNPDGYEFTHTGARLWRKNRNDNGGNRCKGVDLNRNWDYRWGGAGVSRTNMCSDVYCGTKAASEPEVVAISSHVMGQKSRMKAYIAFHCFTQLWLVPPGDGPKPADFGNLMKVGEGVVAAMKAIHGQSYQAGSPQDILYSASGGSLDWAHDAVKGPGIKYVYTPELRPSRSAGRLGFQLPVNEIVPASEEAFAGLKYIADVVMRENPVPPPTPAPKPPPANARRRRRSKANRRRTRSTRRRRRRKTSRRRRRSSSRRRGR